MPTSSRTRRKLETGVYCWLNRVNGKVYVGSTARSFHKRMMSHLTRLRGGDPRHRHRHLQAAWEKYGEDAFEWVVLWRCPPEECLEWEQWFIDRLRAADPEHGYNSRPNAGSQLGLRWTVSEEARANLTAASRRTAPQRSVTQAATMARPDVKAKHRAATRAAMSAPRIRAEASERARRQWADNREKMVDAQRRKWIDPVTGQRMLDANKARRVLTDEQEAEIRLRYRRGSKLHGMDALAREFGVGKTTVFHILHDRVYY